MKSAMAGEMDGLIFNNGSNAALDRMLERAHYHVVFVGDGGGSGYCMKTFTTKEGHKLFARCDSKATPTVALERSRCWAAPAPSPASRAKASSTWYSSQSACPGTTSSGSGKPPERFDVRAIRRKAEGSAVDSYVVHIFRRPGQSGETRWPGRAHRQRRAQGLPERSAASRIPFDGAVGAQGKAGAPQRSEESLSAFAAPSSCMSKLAGLLLLKASASPLSASGNTESVHIQITYGCPTRLK